MRKKLVFFIFLLETLIEAVLTGTHNGCFGMKRRKILYTPVLPQINDIKVGSMGVYISRTCYPNVLWASLGMQTFK